MPSHEIIKNARNLFRYLAEIKALQSPTVRDVKEYENVIWLSDIPRENLCYCSAWALFGEPGEDDGSGAWVSVQKPKLTPPPELPDGIDSFVNSKEWRDSSQEQPSLTEPSREALIRHFLPDEDLNLEVEELNIEENEDIFEAYVQFVDEKWQPWAFAMRESESPNELPPEPPDLIQPWLKQEHLNNYHLEEPPISEQLSIEVDRKFEEARRLLEEKWESYLKDEWHPWAAEDRQLQKVQKIYNELYTTYQSFQRLGEQYEVVLGIGFLNWSATQGGRVRRHVLVCDVSLSFDAGAGHLYVAGNPNGLQLRLEADMLQPVDRPQQREIELIESEIKGIGDDVWDEAFLRHMPRAFVNAISDDRGQFEFGLERKPIDGDIPRIDLAPAIILRRRSQRGYIRLLTEMENQIDELASVPAGIREMIDPEAAEAARKERLEAGRRLNGDIDPARAAPEIHSAGIHIKPITDTEIYFPLPANKEQFEIAHRLEFGRGVLVQGPPGTGKTHTITNLICHLLANGSRILITSETPRGLQSLQSKFEGLARPIADLCVLLLGHDVGALEELERSIQAINTKLNSFDEHEAKVTVNRLQNELREIRSDKREAEQDLKAIRESDTYKHNRVFDRYSGTLETIAQRIAFEEPKCGWLRDDVDESVNMEDIFASDAEIFARKWFNFSAPSDIDRNYRTFESDKLPSPDVFAEKVRDLQSQELIVANLKKSADPAVEAAAKEVSRQKIQTLRSHLKTILTGIRQLKEHIYPWAFLAGKEILAEQDRRWRELLRATKKEIDRCSEDIREISSAQVEGVDEKDVRRLLRHTQTLKRHVEEGNKLKKGLLQPKRIKEAFDALAAVSLDGDSVRDVESLERLIRWLVAKDAIANLKRHWSEFGPLTSGALNLQWAEFCDRIEPLELAVDLHTSVTDAQQEINEIGSFGAPVWHSIEHLQKYVDALDLQGAIDTLLNLENDYEDLHATAVAVLKIEKNFSDAVDSAFRNHNSKEYTTLVGLVERYNTAAASGNEILNTARSIRRFLPQTFEDLCAAGEIGEWPQRFRDLEAAIDWKRTKTWLATMCDPKGTEALSKNVAAFDVSERRIIGELAAEKAWSHCLARLNEPQRRSLIAWMQAVSKIGKGTGKYAERHRATAREELRNCQSAIPAWVMPMHRVVENVTAMPGQFDVAIIDEASQSGPEAIILNYIAKKVIVVGDDKQIRPLNIGIDHEEAEHFRKRYLSGIAQSQSFDLNSSYFSQAALRFPNFIRLKEHFRCMPEIILFSNNHFYANDPLVPLRQFGGGRLLPVVSAEYVKGGYRSGTRSKTINEPEARRVVELIAERCEDPKYEGKSMGVICLAGGQQDQLIQHLLIDEIGAEEIEERNLLVGRPYTFQGDERDVIFLSMVNAPEGGGRCRMVSGASKEREFNVAASRARDQMILVHSATLNDLNPACLQYKLLEHCLSPKILQDEVEGLTIDQIRLASRSERVQGRQPPPFDSWFEVDVFLRISDRGYRVIPQYLVNPFDRTFRIDMVVEGVHGRLAVECDGDQWHGPERYDEDMARQRELERAGWRFWRVRGGAFYHEPDAAMESLWEELDLCDIHPHGQEPKDDDIAKMTSRHLQSISNEPDAQGAEFNEFSSVSDSVSETEASGSVSKLTMTKKRDISAKKLQKTVIKVLKNNPNNSIAVKSLTSAVLKELDIRTRGAPRLELDKRIRRSVGLLKRQGIVKEYKAKNVRIRLQNFELQAN